MVLATCFICLNVLATCFICLNVLATCFICLNVPVPPALGLFVIYRSNFPVVFFRVVFFRGFLPW